MTRLQLYLLMFLQIADVAMTAICYRMANNDCMLEANPIGRALLLQYGIPGLVLGKILGTTFVLYIFILMGRDYLLFARRMGDFVNGVMTAVILMNVFTILDLWVMQ